MHFTSGEGLMKYGCIAKTLDISMVRFQKKLPNWVKLQLRNKLSQVWGGGCLGA